MDRRGGWSSPKWQTLRLLPSVDGPLTAALAALVVVSGLLPVGIMYATGAMVGAIPAAIGAGLGSVPGHHAVAALVVLAVCFLTLQAASTARAAVGAALGWRLNRSLEQRVMAAVARPAGIGHLEDPALLDGIARARDVVFGGYRPCDAVPALANRGSAWLQAAAAAVVLSTYRWWLGPVVLAAWACRARVLKRRHAGGAKSIGKNAPALRRGEYLRDLALAPPSAKEVRVFGLTQWLVDRFRAEAGSVVDSTTQTRSGDAAALWGSGLTATAATLLAYGILAMAAARGDLNLHGLALYTAAITGLTPIAQMNIDNFFIALGTVPVVSVATVESSMAQVAGPTGKPPPAHAPRRSVRFEDVTFRYPGAAQDALRHLNLELPSGCSTAVVGANGAGKTTLVKLLCRFYEPDTGRITVDGQDVSELEAGAWQRHVAAVFQDFVRYPASARDNIAFGAAEYAADAARVQDAATRAGAREVLSSLPGGIDTVLASNRTDGVDLSGGQWQRLVLARALFAASAGASILVLDEPAANLDARGEAELYERFLDLTRGLTTVVISHRFSTVRQADVICVLDGGRVVEQGSHDDLMASNGHYARMFALQAARLAGAPVPDLGSDG